MGLGASGFDNKRRPELASSSSSATVTSTLSSAPSSRFKTTKRSRSLSITSQILAFSGLSQKRWTISMRASLVLFPSLTMSASWDLIVLATLRIKVRFLNFLHTGPVLERVQIVPVAQAGLHCGRRFPRRQEGQQDPATGLGLSSSSQTGILLQDLITSKKLHLRSGRLQDIQQPPSTFSGRSPVSQSGEDFEQALNCSVVHLVLLASRTGILILQVKQQVSELNLGRC
jgi:hypothetical protein